MQTYIAAYAIYIVSRLTRDKSLSQIQIYVKPKDSSLSQIFSWLIQVCICHYFTQLQAIRRSKSMTTRLTSLHSLSNPLTNNDLDSIGYLFRLISYYAA